MRIPFRIALTGGPGGGKTTAADLFRREVGSSVVVVPEAATLLFSGGFPRVHEDEAVRHTQRALYHTQRALEDVHASLYSERVLLCDRGTIDGAAYWPHSSTADFFVSLGTSLEDELRRYDAVLFFETAAAGDVEIEGGNRVRTESNAQALELDRRMHTIWCQHPHFTFIPHSSSFFDKLQRGLAALQQVLDDHQGSDVKRGSTRR